MGALERALEEHDVTLFFSESPTNPYLRCIDIQLVSQLCHAKGALVCIDGTFATPINQQAIALGADLVLASATKYLAGHQDVRDFFLSLRCRISACTALLPLSIPIFHNVSRNSE
jgi:cystathionine gamma-synthase